MFKEIISDFKEYKVWFENWIYYRRHAIKMSLAIRLADIKQQAFNRQYHVMLLELPRGSTLVSVSRDDIQVFKRKKWLPRHLGAVELANSVFYSTPLCRNNKSTAEDRRLAKTKYLKYATRYKTNPLTKH
jgi:hypothetical protein